MISKIFFLSGHAPDFDVFVNKNKQSNIILTNVPMRRDRKYIFAQLHAHLGKDDNYNDNYNSDINNHKGSEHSIDDKFYPMEVSDRQYAPFINIV